MYIYGMGAGYANGQTHSLEIYNSTNLPARLVRVLLHPDESEYYRRWEERNKISETKFRASHTNNESFESATAPYHIRNRLFNMSEAISLYSDVVFRSYENCAEQSIIDLIGAVTQWLCDAQAAARDNVAVRARLDQVISVLS